MQKTTRAFGIAAVAGLAAWLIGRSALGAPALAEPPMRASGSGVPQQAAGFEWFWAINGPVSADGGGDMAVDDDGTVFIAGGHGGLDMDGDGIVDIASGATAYVGAHNPFFMKLSKGPSDDRVRLRWTRSPSTPADRTQATIAVDRRGGAYVSGAFGEYVTFENGLTVRGAGGNDAYVARYDGDGSVMWARGFGGPGSDAIFRVASDREGNAYAIGMGVGTFPLDDHGAEFRADGERAGVLLSYAPDGTLRWSHVFGSGAPLALGITVAPDGVVYVTGDLEGAADFDQDGAADLPAPRDRDAFVARFASDGTFLGAWSVGTVVAPFLGPDGDVYLLSVAGGAIEQRYGPADFDGDGRSDVEMKGSGPTGAVLARYSADGDLRWVRSYALETPADIAIRGGQIAMSGNYHGVRDLDEDGEPERVDMTVDPLDETDLAILILSAEDGRPERVWTAPGPGNDWANAVAFSPTEPALYVTGSIQLAADFTGDGEFGEGWAVCDNRGDVFFAHYRLEVQEERVVETREEVEEQSEVEEPREIVLTARGAEFEDAFESSLTWSGLASAEIDVYRNGELVATVPNHGTHTDAVPRGTRGPWEYRVCEAGTEVCSNTARLES